MDYAIAIVLLGLMAVYAFERYLAKTKNPKVELAALGQKVKELESSLAGKLAIHENEIKGLTALATHELTVLKDKIGSLQMAKTLGRKE